MLRFAIAILCAVAVQGVVKFAKFSEGSAGSKKGETLETAFACPVGCQTDASGNYCRAYINSRVDVAARCGGASGLGAPVAASESDLAGCSLKYSNSDCLCKSTEPNCFCWGVLDGCDSSTWSGLSFTCKSLGNGCEISDLNSKLSIGGSVTFVSEDSCGKNICPAKVITVVANTTTETKHDTQNNSTTVECLFKSGR